MKQKHVTTLVAIVILVAWGLIFGFPEDENNTDNKSVAAETKQDINIPSLVDDTDAFLLKTFRQQKSKVWMEVDLEITRLLPDDNEGSRHQKFIAASSSGHTVLVSHNIDLADRVPVNKGSEIRLRGRYEWNDRGGVLHWTHHDPKGRIEGGWIEVNGEKYR